MSCRQGQALGRLVIAGGLAVSAIWSQAQDRREVLDALERERTQQLRETQQRMAPQWSGPAAATWLQPVPDEQPCFVIDRLQWSEASQPGRPAALDVVLQDLGAYAAACLGPQSLDRLRQNLQARLTALGYVTSTLSLPPQNLADGVLKVQLHLGRVSRIDPRGAAAVIGRNALALRAGDVLNLRDIEQSLENLGRLPSQAAQFQIEPGEGDDSSVVALAVPERRRWRVVVGADNAGTRDYGRWQASANLVFDAPLGLSDQLSAYVAGVPRAGHRYQRTGLLSYSIPWGYQLFSLSASRSEHARPIAGLSTTFVENGHDSSWQARWQWTLWRSASARWSAWLGATVRRSRNAIDDVELLLQRRNLRSNDAGFSGWWRREAGEFQLDYEQGISLRQSLGLDFALDPPPLAHTARAQLGWQRELGGGMAGWRHEMRLAWAGVRDPASGADFQALGSRWTVRGFDARGVLSGTEQFTLKQDWRSPGFEWRPGWALQPYAAVDVGRIAGGHATTGRTLVGAAAGLRMQVERWSGDVALAAPLRKPGDFDAAAAVLYASFNFNY